MINRLLTSLSLFFIRVYQITLSPDKGIFSFWLKGRVCRHQPHCSQYAIDHIRNYGFFRSIIPILDRVSNCTPGNHIIQDPVPEPNNNVSTKEMNKKIRIVFFSSAPIGISFMEALLADERFEICGVVTQPDQPSGRGMERQSNTIKRKAQEKGIIEIATPSTLRIKSKQYPGEGKKFQQWLKNIQPDYNLVIAYGKLIPQYILDIPRIASINIHGSLLPAYRGASPIQTCLLNGDSETGITVMRMSAGLDEGDSIKQLHIPLKVTTTTKDLINTFNHYGPPFVNEVLRDFSHKKEKTTPQDPALATLTYKITKEDGLIDIQNMPIEQILRRYNAYYLRPKIYFIYQGKRVIIEDIIISTELWDSNKQLPLIDADFLLNPIINSMSVKPEGKKTMDRLSWKLGYFGR